MESKTFTIFTYGCQMNKYDSERMAGNLLHQGYLPSQAAEKADLILINTCSVRAKAEQKVYSQLGRLKELKEKNPNLIIAVAGCVAQQEGKRIFKKAPHVNLVLGPGSIGQLPELLQKAGDSADKVLALEQAATFQEEQPWRESKIQAWLSIMEGCNNFCSYCIVPYTRGRERSKASAEITKEINDLGGRGYREVTLLGQNVNSYGRDLEESIDFSDLLTNIHQIEEIKRLRFLTSHPRDLSWKLINTMAMLPKICKHLHLPLQSGSDSILRAMNRGYTSSEYEENVLALRKLVPDVGLTTDIIVGFPGESHQDYLATKRLMESIQFDNIFLFNYSPRPETKAASYPDQVPNEIKNKRFEEILNLQKEITLKRNKALEGTIQEILVEGESKNNCEMLTGHTTNGKIVNFPGSSDLIGELVKVQVIKGGLYSLTGKPFIAGH
ncbi:MAG: tRNA (N6-isopentenyl adenosine(37)-C2)-methylthiotransferase MiaB [Candidatus Tectomicrobia bacterium]|uniref:tRNA-2-methylthio-N(6)-dimethylallyladenosine synthase n=1 Tax=Tectimicrobiota bacterium TaxID=2528274 RepID=A0A933GL21_UNCTE|nr:tRNA (N6-isopentenyl adenosine(37)-C2)-methylthiotransferase MiaB [Candidatus Tectomicrobia bacterium]